MVLGCVADTCIISVSTSFFFFSENTKLFPFSSEQSIFETSLNIHSLLTYPDVNIVFLERKLDKKQHPLGVHRLSVLSLAFALQVPHSSTWVRKNITVNSTVMDKAHQNL